MGDRSLYERRSLLHRILSFADPENPDCTRRLCIAWGIVFTLNMFVPLMLAASATKDHGRFGMCVATLLLFALGFLFCEFRRELAVYLLLGSVFVGLSQVLPFPHVVAGSIGMGVGERFGMVGTADNSELVGQIQGELGGFVVIFVAGGILMGVSTFLVLMIVRFLQECEIDSGEDVVRQLDWGSRWEDDLI